MATSMSSIHGAFALVIFVVVMVGCASWVYTFHCCSGQAFAPLPFVGFLRWDISVLAHVVIAVVGLGTIFYVKVLTELVFSSWLRNLFVPISVLAIAIELAWLRRTILPSTLFMDDIRSLSFDPLKTGTDYTHWNSTHFSFLKNDKVVHVADFPKPSAQPVLSKEECDLVMEVAHAHRDLWINAQTNESDIWLTGASYMVFGSDTNFLGLCDAESIFGTIGYHYKYGFRRWLGHETTCMKNNLAHFEAVKAVVFSKLGGPLQSLRVGIARHFGTSPDNIVFGGDQGSSVEDLMPPALIMQLPSLAVQYYVNPHRDAIEWVLEVLESRKICGREATRFALTVPVQLPGSGGGIWWWDGESGNRFDYDHKVGVLVQTPYNILHSIRPWTYDGWFDSLRASLQMFAFKCGSVYYLTH